MLTKSPRKTIVKNLDTVVSKIVRLRDGRCVTCGSTERLTCGHVFSRIAYSTRWDLNNCFCQCWGCNYRHEYDPYPLTEFTRKKLGQEHYDAMHRKYNTPVKYKDFELMQLLEAMKKLYDKMHKSIDE